MSSIPTFVTDHLAATRPESMAAAIERWWGWYTAESTWYQYEETDGTRTYTVNRISIKPARMVAQEWASLLLNERTIVSADDEAVNDFLTTYRERTGFTAAAQGMLERAYALGTGAWAVRVENIDPNSLVSPGARVTIERYDARYILPLSYDEAGCTECAFVSTATIRGKSYTQLREHVRGEAGTYEIRTTFFDVKGAQVELEGITGSFDTASTNPTFALVRPALENTYEDYSPYGVSVFDDALGAVQLVDEFVDNMHRDVHLGQMMVFIADDLIVTDDKGRSVVPRQKDQQLFRKVEASGGPTGGIGSLIESWSPDLRVTQNREGLKTALQALAMRCGLGADYYSLDERGGVKTATEVTSEQSDLFRTIRKHENVLAPALTAIFRAVIDLSARLRIISLPAEYGALTVQFDDSIIEDARAQRAQDLTDLAAGLMQPWEYRMKWYGEDEATARAMTAAEADVAPGPDASAIG